MVLVVRRMPNEQVAAELDVSEITVKVHRRLPCPSVETVCRTVTELKHRGVIPLAGAHRVNIIRN